MTEMQAQRLARCIDFLRPIQALFAESVSEVHWVGARNADPDQGPSYCRTCCDKLVDRLNAEHPDHEYLRDGGWGYESDGHEVCDACGALLNCTLSHCGMEQELEHWESVRICLRGRYQESTAYQLLTLLECAPLDEYWLTAPGMQPYQTERIRRIRRDTHALARRIDGIRARAVARGIKKENGNG